MLFRLPIFNSDSPLWLRLAALGLGGFALKSSCLTDGYGVNATLRRLAGWGSWGLNMGMAVAENQPEKTA
jgi:hypothetical protein